MISGPGYPLQVWRKARPNRFTVLSASISQPLSKRNSYQHSSTITAVSKHSCYQFLSKMNIVSKNKTDSYKECLK
jgi:hypothetical protein